MVRDRRAGRMARPPGAMEQTGTLRQLAGARGLSSFIRNGDSGQTDPCLPSLTGLEEKIMVWIFLWRPMLRLRRHLPDGP